MEPVAEPHRCKFKYVRRDKDGNIIKCSAEAVKTNYGWRCQPHARSEYQRIYNARPEVVARKEAKAAEQRQEAPIEARIEFLQAEIQRHLGVLENRPPPDTLAAFAADTQNVHTKATVNLVQKTVDLVLAIPVPDEYQTNTLKTVGEIVLACKLSKQAAAQMFRHYCSDDSIYEYGPGIYARILNSVWQFIKGSEHKDDLCSILRSEMEDNIDMCAQGNLSRLCNILSGYMESLVVETTAEQLQRRMAEIASSDATDKTTQALRLLQELTIPSHEWGAWLEPLMN